ncbi:hypothetical protein [Paraburkholderia sp. 2C]
MLVVLLGDPTATAHFQDAIDSRRSLLGKPRTYTTHGKPRSNPHRRHQVAASIRLRFVSRFATPGDGKEGNERSVPRVPLIARFR